MFISNDPKIKPGLNFHLHLIGKMMSFYKKKCFSCQSDFGTRRILYRSINGSNKLINKHIWIKQYNEKQL